MVPKSLRVNYNFKTSKNRGTKSLSWDALPLDFRSTQFKLWDSLYNNLSYASFTAAQINLA